MSRLGPVMEAVRDQATLALTPPGLEGYPVTEPAPGMVHLAPGATVAWDSCCDGQLWVRLLPIQPRNLGNTKVTAGGVKCGPHLWDIRMAVGVLRCAAVVDDNGNAPTPAELDADTLQMVEDMEALQHALQNLALPSIVNAVELVEWTPLGPGGGCVGGEWTLAMRTQNCG